jgi:hypothetical protein
VVIGVFIGIQVANWNEEMGERRLGSDYTKRLITELENDLLSNSTMFEYYKLVLISIEDTDRLLSNPHRDAKALVISAYRQVSSVTSHQIGRRGIR